VSTLKAEDANRVEWAEKRMYWRGWHQRMEWPWPQDSELSQHFSLISWQTTNLPRFFL